MLRNRGEDAETLAKDSPQVPIVNILADMPPHDRGGGVATEILVTTQAPLAGIAVPGVPAETDQVSRFAGNGEGINCYSWGTYPQKDRRNYRL